MASANNWDMVILLAALAASVTWQPQAPPAGASLVGAWTMNSDLSDARPDRGDGNPRDRGDDGGRRGGRGGYGGGRGGFRGGFGGGGNRGGGGGRMNPDDAARMRDAMREVTNPPDRLTIVQTGALVIITGGDGRTTRLSPDGKKVKDDNTGIERKTRWEAGKLVSEISGLGPGKMTQTFSVDPESHQLKVTVEMENRGGRSNQPRTITHVYDKDKEGD
jgi:hypothetical protein